MKAIIRKLFFSFLVLISTTAVFAQENPSKKPAKEITEPASNAERIHAKKIRQEQLHKAPEALAKPDSVNKVTKKSQGSKAKTTQKSKQKN